jgi:hypothetical protein
VNVSSNSGTFHKKQSVPPTPKGPNTPISPMFAGSSDKDKFPEKGTFISFVIPYLLLLFF